MECLVTPSTEICVYCSQPIPSTYISCPHCLRAVGSARPTEKTVQSERRLTWDEFRAKHCPETNEATLPDRSVPQSAKAPSSVASGPPCAVRSAPPSPPGQLIGHAAKPKSALPKWLSIDSIFTFVAMAVMFIPALFIVLLFLIIFLLFLTVIGAFVGAICFR